jgi:predicted dehydrogenase
LTRLARAIPTAEALGLELARLTAPWNDPSYDAALNAFFRAVGGGTPASPGLDDGWQSLRVITAIAESASTGRRVTLEQEPRTHGAHA